MMIVNGGVSISVFRLLAVTLICRSFRVNRMRFPLRNVWKLQSMWTVPLWPRIRVFASMHLVECQDLMSNGSLRKLAQQVCIA